MRQGGFGRRAVRSWHSGRTKLAFNLVYNTSPATIGQQITDLVSKAKQIGINITLKSDNFNHMIATYYNVAAPQNVDKWAMEDFGGFSIATYPTMNGIFNCAGTYNIGSYCDKKADALIAASTGGSDPSAVKAEADYLTTQVPSLFQPLNDNIVVWKKTISGQARGVRVPHPVPAQPRVLVLHHQVVPSPGARPGMLTLPVPLW